MFKTIYFSGSISGGRKDVSIYCRIVDALRTAGFRVLAEAVIAGSITSKGEDISKEEIFRRDLSWIDESDAVVAEISTPSLGVGYEIAYARYYRQIPIFCLYSPRHTSRCTAMVSGDPHIRLIEYVDPELDAAVESLLRALRE